MIHSKGQIFTILAIFLMFTALLLWPETICFIAMMTFAAVLIWTDVRESDHIKA